VKADAIAPAAILDQDLPGNLESPPNPQLTKAQCLGIIGRFIKLHHWHPGPLVEGPCLLLLLLGPVDLPKSKPGKQGNREHEQQGRHPAKTKIQVDKPHPDAIFEK